MTFKPLVSKQSRDRVGLMAISPEVTTKFAYKAKCSVCEKEHSHEIVQEGSSDILPTEQVDPDDFLEYQRHSVTFPPSLGSQYASFLVCSNECYVKALEYIIEWVKVGNFPEEDP